MNTIFTNDFAWTQQKTHHQLLNLKKKHFRSEIKVAFDEKSAQF